MRTKTKAPAADGRFAYEGLDRVIHERARLSILTSLMTHPKGLTFNDLKQLCSLTDGNLNRHLSVLEKDAMVKIVKSHDHHRPQTICRITAAGSKRYLEYLLALEQVVRDAAKVDAARVDAAKMAQEDPAAVLEVGLLPSRA